MDRSLYNFGNFFLGLSLACGVCQSIIYFQLGSRMYFLQPFASWYLVASTISCIAALSLLPYFQLRKYWLSCYAGAIGLLFILCQNILIYITLIWVAREFEVYNLIMNFLTLGAGIILALTLVFSKAGQRPWLRAGGVFMLLPNLVFGSALIWAIMSRDFMVNGTFEKIAQWASLAASLIPVFFILNFRSELKLLGPAEQPAPRQESLEGLLGLVGMIALVLAIYFGSRISHESIWSLAWQKKGPEKAQALAKPFEARTFVSSQGDTLKYLLLKPLDYDPRQKYPLVVCLHGGPPPLKPKGPRPVEVPEPAPLLSSQENREKYPAFLFVPQGPPGFSWGGVPKFPAADALVFEALRALEQEFGIDEKRRYVAGGSGGGFGSWHFIGTRPEMFAAAIPFCGAGNPELAPNMVDIPVWAFHGRKDRNVPVRGSRDMVAAIRKAGGNPRYTEFPDAGHNVWPHVAKTPGLLDWLFAQKRD